MLLLFILCQFIVFRGDIFDLWIIWKEKLRYGCTIFAISIWFPVIQKLKFGEDILFNPLETRFTFIDSLVIFIIRNPYTFRVLDCDPLEDNWKFLIHQKNFCNSFDQFTTVS